MPHINYVNGSRLTATIPNEIEGTANPPSPIVTMTTSWRHTAGKERTVKLKRDKSLPVWVSLQLQADFAS